MLASRLDGFAKAISHPAREFIPQYLTETKSCILGDILDYPPFSLNSVAQHLKDLRKLWLIRS
jgi:hypothetical protein